MPDNEINIHIKNEIDVTNSNNPNTKASASKKTNAKASDGGNDAGINFHQVIGVASKIGAAAGLNDLIDIDMGSIHKLQHYGFASAKAISGIAQGSYGGLIMLMIDALCDALVEVRTNSQKEAAEKNAVDQARIELGMLDVSNAQVHINKWNGRVSYNKTR